MARPTRCLPLALLSHTMSKVAPAQIVKQAEDGSGNVLAKLLGFSLALAVAPIGSYYLSLTYLWNGNATWAAITAVVAANLVFVAFIYVALQDDRRERAEREAKKLQ
ncbi:hypothetical protein EXIGLDRAFT_715785 [Exidia glandulosa HHB12029]|uniref:Uncharacterized protein n=1 Tax=Exidia glandulosa HHB12029 TaxID=1314781 RepID=A0A165QJP1_EXIGL|nr:hypothetical protein EXIGLDRAFT_715785 [Exidia glandulosa HHB12029]